VKTGVQQTSNSLKRLDTGFRRYDEIGRIQTSYEIIKCISGGKATAEHFTAGDAEGKAAEEVKGLILGV
jgi:hypothetical protein